MNFKLYCWSHQRESEANLWRCKANRKQRYLKTLCMSSIYLSQPSGVDREHETSINFHFAWWQCITVLIKASSWSKWWKLTPRPSNYPQVRFRCSALVSNMTTRTRAGVDSMIGDCCGSDYDWLKKSWRITMHTLMEIHNEILREDVGRWQDKPNERWNRQCLGYIL